LRDLAERQFQWPAEPAALTFMNLFRKPGKAGSMTMPRFLVRCD
jgi:hypothetical protein